MLKLREIRPWAKTWFSLELILTFAVLVAGLSAVPLLWGWDGPPGVIAGLALSAGAAVAIFAFFRWMKHNARRSLPGVHEEHRRRWSDAKEDLTDVAAAPDLPPWMGGVR